jgi:mycofactocin system glycosyltransferase
VIDSNPPTRSSRLRIDRRVRRRGHTVIGGTPRRILRLTDAGSEAFDLLSAGRDATTPAGRALARRLLDAGFAHPLTDRSGPCRADVAVVIPVLDDAEGLDRLLGSGALEGVAEVVVVDDGSADPEVGAVAERHGVRLLVNDTIGGPGAARDRGWRAADEPVIAFVDADCVPERGWLEPLLAYLGDDDVVAVAPRVSGINGPSTGLLSRFEHDHGPIDRGRGPARVGVGAVTFVPSAALLVRRESLVEAGGFDPQLLVGEDVDLVWRLLELGTVRYEPAVTVTHRSRPTVMSWLRQRYRYGVSAADLDRRHPGRLAAIEMNPWTAASWTLGALSPGRFRLMGPLTAGVSTALLARRLTGVVDRPVSVALELAGKGNLAAGRTLCETLRREWWPVAAVAALGARRLRRVCAVAFLAYPLVDEIRNRPRVGILRGAALSVADDVAYGTGVWAGCLRSRRFGPLLPRVRRHLTD